MSKASKLRLSALAFALIAPITACGTASEPPKQVDLSSEVKPPAAPVSATAKPK